METLHILHAPKHSLALGLPLSLRHLHIVLGVQIHIQIQEKRKLCIIVKRWYYQCHLLLWLWCMVIGGHNII